MVDLPDIPERIAGLPRDSRGFPVPWFVQWFKDGEPSDTGVGEPDFRVIDTRKLRRALASPVCWVCGGVMGKHRIFVIGPMCVVNRVTAEPPSHRACAEFSAKACPFLTKPRMRRNVKDLPAQGRDPAGFHIDRNPGVVCLYETPYYKPFRPQAGGQGVLFRLGAPTQVSWWSDGRRATRAEVEHSINTGFPILEAMAKQDGPQSFAELMAQRAYAENYFPPVEDMIDAGTPA